MSSNIRQLAQHLAKQGRNGDTTLMHFQPVEISILEHLTGRKATTNPTTGMKEGFGFLIPLIASIAGAFAGKAADKLMSPKSSSSTSQSKASEYSEAQGKKALANHQIPLIRIGSAPTPPPGYTPGVSPETGLVPIRQPIGYVTPGGALNVAQPGFAEGGMIPEQEDASELVHETMEALAGNSENPEEVINQFIATFGMDALKQLMQQSQQGGGGEMGEEEGMARGGMLKGPGAGMDDLMTARVSGGHRVALSGDEYVVPADVVSMLGDGSSDAGGRRMDAMVQRVRQIKTGRPQQAPKINEKRAMPA